MSVLTSVESVAANPCDAVSLLMYVCKREYHTKYGSALYTNK